MTTQTLLVVDDESDNLDALERIFRKRYIFLRASSASEAIELLNSYPNIDVIITDQRMPIMTGVEFLEKTLVTHPKTVRILLTGYTDIDSIVSAINQGHIFRYITKPWDTIDLTNSVEQAMEHYSRGQLLEIKNKELESALEELTKLDQVKNNFMILINHELKTPLTIISSFLELLIETKLDEEQLSFLDRIKKSTIRLQEIIDDTLILTHMEAGTLTLQKQNHTKTSLIQNSIYELNNELQKKNLEIEFSDLNQTMNYLEIDLNFFKKVIKHLLLNAIRFSPENSIITIQTLESSNKQIIIIENEGHPVPESIRLKLHTPFNLQSEIMNHSKGLGLGLSVADAIIKKHGGSLTIDNIEVPNKNNRVRVSIALF